MNESDFDMPDGEMYGAPPGYDGKIADAIMAKESMFCDREKEEKIIQRIKMSSPSDFIFGELEELTSLMSLWKPIKGENGADHVPSDIFFAGDVPLLNCIIRYHCKDEAGEGFQQEAQVVIFDDYMNIIAKAETGIINIGAVLPHSYDRAYNCFFYPIYVEKGNDSIVFFDIGFFKRSQDAFETLNQYPNQRLRLGIANMFMTVWYSIQIALLHPTVKTIFQHPQTERIYNPSHDKKKDKRVTCYVKKHVIKSGDVESAMRGGDRNFTRKTMVWYVIGHWRNYSDGRKVFVHPYWKGPLRELKQNTDEGRERKIAIGGDAV